MVYQNRRQGYAKCYNAICQHIIYYIYLYIVRYWTCPFGFECNNSSFCWRSGRW